MIKVGILGLGFIGQGHLLRCQASPLAKVTAVADADVERLEGRAALQGNIDLGQSALDLSGVERFRDAADLIDRADVDAVLICLPTPLHAPMAIRAAGRGKHIFCEKPIARSLDEADAMIAAAERAGVRLMIGQCLRFWPEYRYLKQLVASRRLGALRSLSLSRLSSVPLWSAGGWTLDARQGGSALVDMHIHDVDVVNWLLGEPQGVTASGCNLGCSDGIDWVEAAYDYGPGLRVQVRGGWLNTPTFGFEASYDALFERGLVRYNGGWERTLVEHVAGATEPAYPPMAGDAYADEIDFFLNCLETGQDPATAISPQEARSSLAIVLAEERCLQG